MQGTASLSDGCKGSDLHETQTWSKMVPLRGRVLIRGLDCFARPGRPAGVDGWPVVCIRQRTGGSEAKLWL